MDSLNYFRKDCVEVDIPQAFRPTIVAMWHVTTFRPCMVERAVVPAPCKQLAAIAKRCVLRDDKLMFLVLVQ